jgi:hypothetical protein
VEPLVQAFHQFTTCFFNFPSRYSTLSVNGAYLALMMEHLSCLNRQGSIKAAWQAANSPRHLPSPDPIVLPQGWRSRGLRRRSLLRPRPAKPGDQVQGFTSGGTEKSEQSRAITGLSPSMASYSKLLFVPLLDRGLPLQPVPKERDLGREARSWADQVGCLSS